MTAPRLDSRILTALLLAPLDSRQLSRSLSVPLSSACRSLAQLQQRVLVRRVGVMRSHRRPAISYQLTTTGRSVAQQAIA